MLDFDAVPSLRQSVAGLSPQRLGFDPWSFHARSVVDKVVLAHFFLRILRFSPVSIIPPVLQTFFIYILILTEGQTGETWEPSKKQCSFGNQRALDRQVPPLSL